DDRDDDTVSSERDGTEDGDAEPRELTCGKRSCRIVAALPDKPGLSAERRRRGRDVGRLPAGARPSLRRGVGARLQRLLEADAHIELQVAAVSEDAARD